MMTLTTKRTTSTAFNRLSGAEAQRQTWRQAHLAQRSAMMNRYLGALAPVVEID